jgi:hypothetical protein
MKRILYAAALATITASAFAADVGVSITIGQPGYYGRLDIDGYPPPQVIYREPRVIYRSAMQHQPIYLHVAPGHQKNWRKHCREYNACGERVYFVRGDWYEHEYIPHYQKRHHDRRDDRRDDHRDDHRGDNGDNRHNDNHDHGRNH